MSDFETSDGPLAPGRIVHGIVVARHPWGVELALEEAEAFGTIDIRFISDDPADMNENRFPAVGVRLTARVQGIRMITEEEAVGRAEELLNALVRPWVDEEIAVNAPATVRTKNHWVIFYNTKAYLETKSTSHALAGNGPVIVSAEDGTARLASSATPWEDQV